MPDVASTTVNWVDEHGDALFGYAVARVSDRQAAEDLVQDTLLAALQSRQSFENRSTEKTWLFGILKHKILDHYRKSYRGINKDIESTDDIDRLFSTKGMWAHPPTDWGDSPDEITEKKEFLAVLRECIGHLPEAHKAVFIAREIDDLDGDEICKKLSITSTNLWVILYRARLKLRKCLEANWAHDERTAE